MCTQSSEPCGSLCTQAGVLASSDVPVALSAETIRDAPKVLLHDHLDGGLRARYDHRARRRRRLRRRCRPTTRRSWPPGSSVRRTRARWCATSRRSGTPSACCRPPKRWCRVASECAQDLAADGVVYAEVRFAPELHVEQGLALEDVVEAVLEGFRVGTAAAAAHGRRVRVGCLLTAMRHAARSREIAELAIRYRDVGVVGFDIAGAEAGFPPTRHLDAFEYLRQRERALHDPRGRGVRAAVHLGGAAVVRGRPARARRADRRRHHRRRRRHRQARPPRRLRARQADPAGDVPDVQRPHRAPRRRWPSTRSACSPRCASGSR